MKICIPSYRRVNLINERTLSQIPPNLWKNTMVFVRHEEYDRYRAKVNPEITVVGIEANDISTTRWCIGHHCQVIGSPTFMMLDDDLTFVRREGPSTVKLIPCDELDMNGMFASIRNCLGRVVHAGISMRQGNNNVGVGSADVLVDYNTRIIRAVAYRTKEFMELEHKRINYVEDLDYTLQLLRRGKRNICLYWWAQDQGMANAPGGCSETRTREVQADVVRKLHEFHPDFVTIVEKKNKTGGEFGTRLESRIQWKAAYAEGIENARNKRELNQRVVQQRDETAI